MHGWKPRCCTFVELRGAFVRIWKLERLIWARKNLGLWRVWKLGECFSGLWKLRGWLIACVETWYACTLETFGVHSRFGGTSVVFVRMVELWARSVVVLWCSVGVRWAFFFSAFRGTRWLWSYWWNFLFAFVYIFRSVGGVLSAW